MSDPLPSWNDGAAKQAIISFVKQTTIQGNPEFVEPAERIATFTCAADRAISHVHVFSRGSDRVPIRQLRNCGKTTAHLHADAVRLSDCYGLSW